MDKTFSNETSYADIDSEHNNGGEDVDDNNEANNEDSTGRNKTYFYPKFVRIFLNLFFVSSLLTHMN